MAESDASESSVLVDLSDQIDAEFSEEGGSICRAESVPRYNRTDTNLTASTATKRLPKTISRAEPRPVDMAKNQRIKNKS